MSKRLSGSLGATKKEIIQITGLGRKAVNAAIYAMHRKEIIKKVGYKGWKATRLPARGLCWLHLKPIDPDGQCPVKGCKEVLSAAEGKEQGSG